MIMKNEIEVKPYPTEEIKEEIKAIKTNKKPFLPTRAMLKSIELKLDLRRYTKEEICKSCGIRRMTLYRWERNPDYLDLYMKRSWEVLRAYTPEVNKALQRAINKGDVQAMKMFYQLTENIREAMEITFSFGGDKRND